MAQYISVKKEQQTNKHAPLAIMLCLLLLFSSLFITSSVFADTEVSLLVLPYSPDNMASLPMIMGSSETACSYYEDENLYCFCYPTYTGSDRYNVLLCYDSTSSNSPISFYKYNSGTVSTNTPSSWNVNSTYNIKYYGQWNNFPASNVNLDNVPVYSDLNTGLEAVRSYIDNPPPSGDITNNGNAIIVVNPGNVAYIGYNSATFNFLINLDKPVSNFSSNARYGFATELPSGVLTFTPSSGNSLPLRKSVPDLLGRSATWVGSVDTDTIGYFIVYNPVYDLNGNTNKPIRVTVTLGYMNVTQFPLTATDIGGDIVSSGNSDNFYISDGMQGGTDLPSYIYSNTDQSGNVTTSPALTVPVTPYNYTEPSNGSAESGLQGFLQQILDLLSAPIKHIQNLYNSAVSFFNYLTSLWSWLPPELITIITSALVVLVVIGVVKFLWK